MIASHAGAIVVASDQIEPAAADAQRVALCLKQANAKLKVAGVRIKRGDFDAVHLGTDGPDDLGPGVFEGRDLICGFAGDDHIGEHGKGVTIDDDVFVGGAGDDYASTVYRAIFIGSTGDDYVDGLADALAVGGDGDDRVRVMKEGGHFYGEGGDDTAAGMSARSVFSGGTGRDFVRHLAGGFYGGAGIDAVTDVDDGATWFYVERGGVPCDWR
jgi:hypothetical protein